MRFKARERKAPPLVPFIRPEGPTTDTKSVFEALTRNLPETNDPRYPGHDEEAFQEGYPRKGGGGYGSPGAF